MPRPTRSPATVTIAFPDVCKTPAPGGPVPIPYPNFSAPSEQSQQRFSGHMENLRAAGQADAAAANGNPQADDKRRRALDQLFHRTGMKAGSAMQAVMIGKAIW